MRSCFHHTDLGQNAVFRNFAIKIAIIQNSGQDDRITSGLLAKPQKHFQNHLYGQPVVACGVFD